MDELEQHYATLKIRPGASLEKVAMARSILIRAWHPDRHGNSPEMHQRALEKTKAINAAYDAIKRHLEARGDDASDFKSSDNDANAGEDATDEHEFKTSADPHDDDESHIASILCAIHY